MKGTHESRLATFKIELDKHIANVKAGHNLELYAELESIIDKNHYKKFPNASMSELNSVLCALAHKKKIMDFIIQKNQTKIGLPNLKIYAEIEAMIDKNGDKDEIYIDYHTEYYFSVYEEQIHIEIIKGD